MAKFLAKLLGCTLPSKGASPMCEVGGGCVPAATAVGGGGLSPDRGPWTVSLAGFPPAGLGWGGEDGQGEAGNPGA